jgi:tubulin monoglycylase TTLL3/8
VSGRKFDIRVFVLLAADPKSGRLQSWLYEEGYLRTSSAAYSLSAASLANSLVHLTNDGIQSKDAAGGYGKYEEGNKLSYGQFQAHLDEVACPRGERRGWVSGGMVDDMQAALREVVRSGCGAAGGGLNPQKRRNCFQLLGCDFMVDEKFHLKLIEVQQKLEQLPPTTPTLSLSPSLRLYIH